MTVTHTWVVIIMVVFPAQLGLNHTNRLLFMPPLPDCCNALPLTPLPHPLLHPPLPCCCRQVLIDCPGTFIKTGTAFFPGSSLAGNGLLVSDGDVWRRQRQLVAPAFRRTVVETYAAAMVGNTAEMLRWGGGGAGRWRDGVVREVYGEFSQLTLRITLTALFGAGLDAETGKEVTGEGRTPLWVVPGVCEVLG